MNKLWNEKLAVDIENHILKKQLREYESRQLEENNQKGKKKIALKERLE